MINDEETIYNGIKKMRLLAEEWSIKINTSHSSANGQFISGTSSGAGDALPKTFGKGATFTPLKTYAGDVVKFDDGQELRANPHQFSMTTANGTKYRATQVEALRTKTKNYTAKEIENNAMRASTMAKAMGASDIIHPIALAKDDKGNTYLVEDHIQTTGAHMPGSDEGIAAVEKMSGDDAVRNLAVQYVTALGERQDGNNIRVEQDGTVSHVNTHHGLNDKTRVDGVKMPENNYLLRKKGDQIITPEGERALQKIVDSQVKALKAATPYTSSHDLAMISERFSQMSRGIDSIKQARRNKQSTTVKDFFRQASTPYQDPEDLANYRNEHLRENNKH